MATICLDPGHNTYGTDTGAQGNGLLEQDLTLDIARRLKPLLEYNGFSVVMTRDGDCVPGGETLNGSLQSRVSIAENAGANLFVSLHINAGGGTGQEVLIYSGGGSAEKCAGILLYYLVQAAQWYNRGVKTQNVYVLRKTSMPAVLTESGFIDTAEDAAKLANPDFRQQLARAHAKGICEYFGVEFKEQESAPVAQAQPVVEAPKSATVSEKTGSNRVTPTGANITPLNGGGWIESLPDRLIIHYNEYRYITIGTDGVVAYTPDGTQKVI